MSVWKLFGEKILTVTIAMDKNVQKLSQTGTLSEIGTVTLNDFFSCVNLFCMKQDFVKIRRTSKGKHQGKMKGKI